MIANTTHLYNEKSTCTDAGVFSGEWMYVFRPTTNRAACGTVLDVKQAHSVVPLISFEKEIGFEVLVMTEFRTEFCLFLFQAVVFAGW